MNDTKRNATISATIVTNETDNRPCALHLKFANGQELAITASQLSNHVMEYAIFHGLKQKLVMQLRLAVTQKQGGLRRWKTNTKPLKSSMIGS